MRQLLSTALVAGIVGALAGASMGAVAQAPLTPTAIDADTVDGKSAVGATAKKKLRANKLVAADAKGFLPANIVKAKWGLISSKPAFLADGQIAWSEVADKPADLADGQIGWAELANKPADLADGQIGWAEVANKPADLADGVDDVGYVTATTACPTPVPASPGFTLIEFFDLPRSMVHDFQVVPTASAGYIFVDEIETLQLLDGSLKVTVKVTNASGPATSCNIRRISFTSGISIASAKKQLKAVKVQTGKRKRR